MQESNAKVAKGNGRKVAKDIRKPLKFSDPFCDLRVTFPPPFAFGCPIPFPLKAVVRALI